MAEEKPELHICITEGVSKTARYLLYEIARANIFNEKHDLKLHLTDAKQHFDTLGRIVKEFHLSGIKFMKDISFLSIKDAFEIADILILLHPERGRCGPDPYDYLQPYVEIFKEQGLALVLFAKPSTRVVVAGDLANTHARVLLEYAKEFPPKNISAVTRLNAVYGRAVLAEKLEVDTKRVRNVLVTGNCTGVQNIDAMSALLEDADKNLVPVADLLKNEHLWLRKTFVQLAKDASKATVNVHLPQNALSLAHATFEHVRELCLGSPRGSLSSAGIYLDKPLAGMRPGIFISLPVHARKQCWHIDKDSMWKMGCMRIQLNVAANQLHAEAKAALKILAERKYEKEHPPRRKSSSLLNVSEVGRWLDELIAKATLSKEDIPSVEDLLDKYLGSGDGSVTSGSQTSVSKSVEIVGEARSAEKKASRESVKTGSKGASFKESSESLPLKGVKTLSKEDNSLKSSLEEEGKGSVKSKRSGSIAVSKVRSRESRENFDRKSRPSVTIVDYREEKPHSEGMALDQRASNELIARSSKASVKIADSKEENKVRGSMDTVERKGSLRSRPSVTIVDSREGKMTKASMESVKRKSSIKIVDSKEKTISESAEKLSRGSKESLKDGSKTSLKKESSGKLAK